MRTAGVRVRAKDGRDRRDETVIVQRAPVEQAGQPGMRANPPDTIASATL